MRTNFSKEEMNIFNLTNDLARGDFSIYVDDNVKVFAKDLKEYDGTTLQYVGIMPVSTELDKFIEEIDKVTVDNYISSLKGLKHEDFKEGVVTKIRGYIPKFKFNEFRASLY